MGRLNLKEICKLFDKDEVSDTVPDIQALADESVDSLETLLNDFRNEGRISPTFQFWDDFLTRVILPFKLFFVASRKGHGPSGGKRQGFVQVKCAGK